MPGGFEPELEAFLENHPSAEVEWIMGGLAPDTLHPMDEHLKRTIAFYWRQIEAKTQVTFNHDFWKRATPYRSTYPACRAVIAAESLRAKSAQPMVKAIQSAYYQEAKNPSLDETLMGCAGSIGLDEKAFAEVFHASETEQRFQQHLRLTYRLQVRAFPALFYVDENKQTHPLTRGYTKAAHLQQQLNVIPGK